MEKSQLRMNAGQVHGLIGRFMPAEGLDIVVDFERSRGVHLFDAKREEFFLDLFSFYSTMPVGFNHPRMVARETVEALGRVALHKPSNSDVYSLELAEFVETFGGLAKPEYMQHLFFIEGGAAAVENALKAAFDWKVRLNLNRGCETEKGFKVIHFERAFHGRSGYTLSLTNTADLRKTQYFPKFKWPRIISPACSFPLERHNLQQVIELEEAALNQIRKTIEQDSSEEIACLILEPIQGEGGDNHFRPEFHQALRDICNQHEILLVYDEVQTGLGATGKMWAYEHYVQPDLIAFGKKTQVCGFMAGPRIDEIADNVFRVPSRINSTWGGNLVDMVRCRIYLEIIGEEGLVEHGARVGEGLLVHLRALEEEFPEMVSNARGKGLFCAFDLPSGEVRRRLRERLFANRLLILPCGERSLRFRPALNITAEEIRDGIDLIRKSLREI